MKDVFYRAQNPKRMKNKERERASGQHQYIRQKEENNKSTKNDEKSKTISKKNEKTNERDPSSMMKLCFRFFLFVFCFVFFGFGYKFQVEKKFRERFDNLVK